MPPWRRVIPTKDMYTTTAMFDRRELMATIRRVAVGAELPKLLMRLHGGEMTITTAGAKGRNTDKVQMQLEGKRQVKAVNYRYLMDSLSRIDGEEAALSFTHDKRKMMRIQDPADTNNLFVIALMGFNPEEFS